MIKGLKYGFCSTALAALLWGCDRDGEQGSSPARENDRGTAGPEAASAVSKVSEADRAVSAGKSRSETRTAEFSSGIIANLPPVFGFGTGEVNDEMIRSLELPDKDADHLYSEVKRIFNELRGLQANLHQGCPLKLNETVEVPGIPASSIKELVNSIRFSEEVPAERLDLIRNILTYQAEKEYGSGFRVTLVERKFNTTFDELGVGSKFKLRIEKDLPDGTRSAVLEDSVSFPGTRYDFLNTTEPAQ